MRPSTPSLLRSTLRMNVFLFQFCPDRETEGAKIEISRGRLLHPCTVEAVSSKKDEND
jgi:hypothetical protein